MAALRPVQVNPGGKGQAATHELRALLSSLPTLLRHLFGVQGFGLHPNFLVRPSPALPICAQALLMSGTTLPLRIWPLSAILAPSSWVAVLSFFPLDSALMASATGQPLTSSPKMV